MKTNYNTNSVTSSPASILLEQREQQPLSTKDPDQLLKYGVWAYFILLIVEGALRKWFLPGLATPLLIIRDPIALWLLAATWQRGLLPSNLYLSGMMLIGIIGIYTAVLTGHGDLTVALYGARSLLIHFPLIFVIGRIFNRDDVIKLGKVVLWLSMPMVLLILLQFYSPQSAWVNRGLGGDIGGAGFSGALGFYRPPATFSFTNGTTLFFSFTAGFIFYFWVVPKGVDRLMLYGATIALLVAIPLSISRGLFFSVGVSLAFAIIAVIRQPKYMVGLIPAVVGVIAALAILSQTNVFQTATAAFTSRFETASDYRDHGLQGLLVGRYLGGLVGALAHSVEQPFFGHGLGMGSNVGSVLLTGDRQFLISEEEWGRAVGELGPLLGFSVILLRLGLSAKIAMACYQKLVQGVLLPWMLLGFGMLMLPQGGWAQPTSLGFCVLVGGLLIASLRDPGPHTKLPDSEYIRH